MTFYVCWLLKEPLFLVIAYDMSLYDIQKSRTDSIRYTNEYSTSISRSTIPYAIKKMVSRDCVFLEKALLRKIKTEIKDVASRELHC